MRLTEALTIFLEDYVWFRGYSPATARNYKLGVNSFIATNGDLDIQDITMEHIKKWRYEMERNRRDTNGMAAYLYRVRLLLRWLKRKYGIPIDLDDLVIPKRVQKLPNYFQIGDIEKLINAVPPNRFDYNVTRNKAIIALMYSSGIRLGELTRIRLRDMRGDEIKIRGKGNKERIVFIDQRAKGFIDSYLTQRPQRSEYLFVTFRNKQMDKTSIEKLMKEAAWNAGFKQNISPHIYRHSFATHLLQRGCNIRYIQEMLGHADISTTQIYTHVAKDDLRKVYEQFH